MQDSLSHHKLFHFHLSPFEFEKCGKEGKTLQKTWISQEGKELFRWNKKIFFTVFEGLSFDEKVKIWWKIADTSFNHG